ncbi:uncharacterized protein [Narcine bancroftii]|uniref:uncharacterized protein n=1 Tax=Narcine bancroftii TaxID=1343680 RepID=UPI0038315EC4
MEDEVFVVPYQQNCPVIWVLCKEKQIWSNSVRTFPVRLWVWTPDDGTPKWSGHRCSGPPADHTCSNKSQTLEAQRMLGRARGCVGAVSSTFLRIPDSPNSSAGPRALCSVRSPTRSISRMHGSTSVDFIKKPAPSCGDKTGAGVILSPAGVLCGLEVPDGNSVVPTERTKNNEIGSGRYLQQPDGIGSLPPAAKWTIARAAQPPKT